MTQQNRRLPHALLAATLAALLVGLILLPAGASLPHALFELMLLLAAGGLSAFAYARVTADAAPEPLQDAALRPEIEWLSVEGALVPRSLLTGAAPLVAVVAEGQVPHPDMAATLVPYFADPTVAYVQGATRYDGESGVAHAWRLTAFLGDHTQAARGTLGAPALRGSGAIICRQAAREAYRPGDTWESLGLRLNALGYAGRFEFTPMVLAWAPLTLDEYAPRLVADTRRALGTLVLCIRSLELPLEARLQYLGAAAVPLAAWAAAATAALSAIALVLFNTGPFIATSPAALPGVGLALILAGTVWYTLYRLTSVNALYPVALALCGAYQVSVKAAQHYIIPPAQRAWGTARSVGRSAANAAATAATTARAGGNGGTAPAGTPAHS